MHYRFEIKKLDVEQFLLHADLAESSEQSSELYDRSDSFQNPHVSETDFLLNMQSVSFGRSRTREGTDPDELQLRVLGQALHSLDDSEQRRNNINGSITLFPELLQLLHRSVNLPLDAIRDERLNFDRMRLIADFKDFLRSDKVES